MILLFGYLAIQATCDDYEDWFEALKEFNPFEEFQPVKMDQCPSIYNICNENQFCQLIKMDSTCDDADDGCVTQRKAVCNEIILPESNEIMVERGDTIQWDTVNDDAESYQDPNGLVTITTPAPAMLISISYNNYDDSGREKRNVSNCEYFPIKNTYKCKNWSSRTLSQDVQQARLVHTRKPKRKYHLRIYSDKVHSKEMEQVINQNYNSTSDFFIDDSEWVTRFIYVSCLNRMTLRYARWAKAFTRTKTRQKANDMKIMKLAVAVKTKCHIPLTPLRKRILQDLLMIFIKKAKHASTREFLTTMANRVSLISPINPAKENSYLKKSVRHLFRFMVSQDVYSLEMIKSLVNQTNTIPEVPDELIRKRLEGFQAKFDKYTTNAKVIEEIYQTMRKSDVR